MNKKYIVSIQTGTIQIGNNVFLMENPVLIKILQIIVQNQLGRFNTALRPNNVSKARNHTPHTSASNLILTGFIFYFKINQI